jgi:hypothetical protein
VNAKRACIYYPLIKPPTAWIKQSLLYWDTVCSVVHADFKDALPDDLEWLLDEGLYEPLFADVIPNQEKSRLRAEVLHCVENAQDLGLDLTVARAETIDFLYYGKLPSLVQEDLVDRGLAEKRQKELILSHELLTLVLCLLAKYIASALSVGTDHYALYTDTTSSAVNNFLPLQGSEITTATQLVLRDVLPVPDESVSLASVIRFREKHSSRLGAFRRALDRLLSELAKEEVDIRLATRARDEVAEELADISARLRSARLRTAWLSVSVLVLPAAGWAALGGSKVATIGPWLLSGLGTNALMEIGRRKVRRGQLKQDFSYLQKAIKRFA